MSRVNWISTRIDRRSIGMGEEEIPRSFFLHVARQGNENGAGDDRSHFVKSLIEKIVAAVSTET